MKTFTDNADRTWTIAINVDTLKRVRSLLNVDLLDILGGKLVERLVRDPVLLCDVVYAVCKPEADTRNVSDEDFGRAMAGDAIEHATRALLDDVVDFYPSPRDRANVKAAIEALDRMLERERDLIAQTMTPAVLDRMFAAVMTAVRNGQPPEDAARQALQTPGLWSGGAPASSESTPAP